jgi:hypothetical protein
VHLHRDRHQLGALDRVLVELLDRQVERARRKAGAGQEPEWRREMMWLVA